MKDSKQYITPSTEVFNLHPKDRLMWTLAPSRDDNPGAPPRSIWLD